MTTAVHYAQFFLACEEGDLNALQLLFSSLAPEEQRELLELGDWDCFQTVAHKGHAALLEFLITKLRGLYEPEQIDRLCDRHVFTNILCSVDMNLDALRKISPVRVQDRYDAILSALLPLCRDNGTLPRIHEKFHPCSSECYELAKEHFMNTFGSFTERAVAPPLCLAEMTDAEFSETIKQPAYQEAYIITLGGFPPPRSLDVLNALIHSIQLTKVRCFVAQLLSWIDGDRIGPVWDLIKILFSSTVQAWTLGRKDILDYLEHKILNPRSLFPVPSYINDNFLEKNINQIEHYTNFTDHSAQFIWEHASEEQKRALLNDSQRMHALFFRSAEAGTLKQMGFLFAGNEFLYSPVDRLFENPDWHPDTLSYLWDRVPSEDKARLLSDPNTQLALEKLCVDLFNKDKTKEAQFYLALLKDSSHKKNPLSPSIFLDFVKQSHSVSTEQLHFIMKNWGSTDLDAADDRFKKTILHTHKYWQFFIFLCFDNKPDFSCLSHMMSRSFSKQDMENTQKILLWMMKEDSFINFLIERPVDLAHTLLFLENSDLFIRSLNTICDLPNQQTKAERLIRLTRAFKDRVLDHYPEPSPLTPFIQSVSSHLVTLIQTLSPTEQDSVWEQFSIELRNPNLTPLSCAAIAYQRQLDLKDLKNTPPLSRLWQKFLPLLRLSKPLSPRISSLAHLFSADPHSFFNLPETALALINSGGMDVECINSETNHGPLAALLVAARGHNRQLTEQEVQSTQAVLHALLAQGASIKTALRQSGLSRTLSAAQVRSGNIFRPEQTALDTGAAAPTDTGAAAPTDTGAAAPTDTGAAAPTDTRVDRLLGNNQSISAIDLSAEASWKVLFERYRTFIENPTAIQATLDNMKSLFKKTKPWGIFWIRLKRFLVPRAYDEAMPTNTEALWLDAYTQFKRLFKKPELFYKDVSLKVVLAVVFHAMHDQTITYTPGDHTTDHFALLKLTLWYIAHSYQDHASCCHGYFNHLLTAASAARVPGVRTYPYDLPGDLRGYILAILSPIESYLDTPQPEILSNQEAYNTFLKLHQQRLAVHQAHVKDFPYLLTTTDLEEIQADLNTPWEKFLETVEKRRPLPSTQEDRLKAWAANFTPSTHNLITLYYSRENNRKHLKKEVTFLVGLLPKYSETPSSQELRETFFSLFNCYEEDLPTHTLITLLNDHFSHLDPLPQEEEEEIEQAALFYLRQARTAPPLPLWKPTLLLTFGLASGTVATLLFTEFLTLPLAEAFFYPILGALAGLALLSLVATGILGTQYHHQHRPLNNGSTNPEKQVPPDTLRPPLGRLATSNPPFLASQPPPAPPATDATITGFPRSSPAP